MNTTTPTTKLKHLQDASFGAPAIWCGRLDAGISDRWGSHVEQPNQEMPVN